MRGITWIAAAALVTLAACGGGSTGPNGGGVTGGGPAGHVVVGNDFFRSASNGSQNPAVDTIAAGSTVTWNWSAAGSHSVQSTGTPNIFRSSVVMSDPSSSYAVTFQQPGTYTYQCSVHGAAMTGRIVVQ